MNAIVTLVQSRHRVYAEYRAAAAAREGIGMSLDSGFGEKQLFYLPMVIQLVFSLIVGALFSLMLLFGQPVE